jgi:hypothetical protein
MKAYFVATLSLLVASLSSSVELIHRLQRPLLD